jgi:PEP-CTERM motif-containing protein
MKISRICVLVLLVVVGSAAAFGDSVTDPTIIIRGASGSAPAGLPVGLNFTFSSPKGGFGNLFFTNASGKNWTSLTLIENGVPAVDITCSTNLFLACTKITLENGSVEIILSGVKGLNPHNGILNGQSFAITFSNWPKNPVEFTAHAGTVPEPGTIALMLTGLGALAARRKVWRNRWN